MYAFVNSDSGIFAKLLTLLAATGITTYEFIVEAWAKNRTQAPESIMKYQNISAYKSNEILLDWIQVISFSC